MTTPAKLALGIMFGAGLFFAGYMANRQPAPAPSGGSLRQVTHYVCPMHPQYKSDHPGDAPCCGMRMVPVYAGGSAGQPEPAHSGSPGTVQISGNRRQLVGVRTDEVQRVAGSHLLRLPGRVTVDESRLYRITSSVDGWIREIGKETPGTFVKRNQILASFYAREFLPAQQTYLFVMTSTGQAQSIAPNLRPNQQANEINVQTALDSLRSLGVSELQINKIRETQTYDPLIEVRSPADGYMLARNVTPEQRFGAGTEMYTIADLTRVWVMADLFEKDRDFVKPGSMATVRSGGLTFHARMSDALPQLDPQSRTLRARFEVENRAYVLRPDAFVDLEVDVRLPAALTVPADALLETGRRKTVYVECAAGTFEPRAVETGWRLGERVQITSGLAPGERVVVAGNFLIDSESRMRLAAGGTGAHGVPAPANAPAKDPICGMDVDPSDMDVLKTVYEGKTYYFCSEHCKKTFEANPGKYVHSKISAEETGHPRRPA